MKPSLSCPGCRGTAISRCQRRMIERIVPRLRSYRCDDCHKRFVAFHRAKRLSVA